MAEMDATNRARTAAQFLRTINRELGGSPVLKPDLRAAVNAADTWVDGNTASFNTALPQPFRGAASVEQKTLLLCYVAMRRAGLLRAEED